MKLLYLFLAAALVAGCSGGESNSATYNTASDTSMRSIDSSALINDTTPLPRDSTAVNVAH